MRYQLSVIQTDLISYLCKFKSKLLPVESDVVLALLAAFLYRVDKYVINIGTINLNLLFLLFF